MDSVIAHLHGRGRINLRCLRAAFAYLHDTTNLQGFITMDDVRRGLCLAVELTSAELNVHASLILESAVTSVVFADGIRRMQLIVDIDGEVPFVQRIMRILLEKGQQGFFPTLNEFVQECESQFMPPAAGQSDFYASQRSRLQQQLQQQQAVVATPPPRHPQSRPSPAPQTYATAPHTPSLLVVSRTRSGSYTTTPRVPSQVSSRATSPSPSPSTGATTPLSDPIKDDFETSEIGTRFLAEIRRGGKLE
jgi:hypothetical protein